MHTGAKNNEDGNPEMPNELRHLLFGLIRVELQPSINVNDYCLPYSLPPTMNLGRRCEQMRDNKEHNCAMWKHTMSSTPCLPPRATNRLAEIGTGCMSAGIRWLPRPSLIISSALSLASFWYDASSSDILALDTHMAKVQLFHMFVTVRCDCCLGKAFH